MPCQEIVAGSTSLVCCSEIRRRWEGRGSGLSNRNGTNIYVDKVVNISIFMNFEKTYIIPQKNQGNEHNQVDRLWR